MYLKLTNVVILNVIVKKSCNWSNITVLFFTAISAPIPILGSHDAGNIIKGGVCTIYNQYFAIFGSVVAFFLPLCVMIVVHLLTIRILRQQITVVSSMMNTTRESRLSCNRTLRVSTVSSNNHKQLLLNDSTKQKSIGEFLIQMIFFDGNYQLASLVFFISKFHTL